MTTPTGSSAPVSRPDLRVSDAERSAVTDRLSAHTAAGRLSLEELEQRVTASYAAVCASDLSVLEADLPGLTPEPGREKRGQGWAALPLVLLALTVLASVLAGHPVVLPLIALVVWRLVQGSGRRVPTHRRTS